MQRIYHRSSIIKAGILITYFISTKTKAMIDKRKVSEEKNTENKPFSAEDPAATPQEENIDFEEIPDLDGDGMIGYTGGNYGDTTYTGGNLNQPVPGPVEEAPEDLEEDDEDDD